MRKNEADPRLFESPRVSASCASRMLRVELVGGEAGDQVWHACNIDPRFHILLGPPPSVAPAAKVGGPVVAQPPRCRKATPHGRKQATLTESGLKDKTPHNSGDMKPVDPDLSESRPCVV